MSPRRSNRKENIEPCFFCVHDRDPDYKDWRILKNFVTARGKIVSRQRSGLCARHQRRLSKAIKRAREVALL